MPDSWVGRQWFVVVGVPHRGEGSLRGHEVDALSEVGQLIDVVSARTLQGCRELEHNVLGRPVPDVAYHYVCGEPPGVVGVYYDLRTILIVASPPRLPTLILNPRGHHECWEGR